MKLPSGLDMDEMMKQAKAMQEELQRDMQSVRVEAAAGGGMVKVVMNGTKELVEIKIDPEVLKTGDIDMLQDMVMAAVNEANRKSDEAMKSKLGLKLGGFGLPDVL